MNIQYFHQKIKKKTLSFLIIFCTAFKLQLLLKIEQWNNRLHSVSIGALINWPKQHQLKLLISIPANYYFRKVDRSEPNIKQINMDQQRAIRLDDFFIFKKAFVKMFSESLLSSIFLMKVSKLARQIKKTIVISRKIEWTSFRPRLIEHICCLLR